VQERELAFLTITLKGKRKSTVFGHTAAAIQKLAEQAEETEPWRPMSARTRARNVRVHLVFDAKLAIPEPKFPPVRIHTFDAAERLLAVEAAIPPRLKGEAIDNHLIYVLSETRGRLHDYTRQQDSGLATDAARRVINQLMYSTSVSKYERRPTTLLSQGMVQGGASYDTRDVMGAIRALWPVIDKVSPPPRDCDLRINIMWLVPGPVSAPDFEGLRTGTFFRSKRTLQIQVAVPPKIEAQSIRRYLKGTLIGVSDLARSEAQRRRKAGLSAEAAETAISQLIRRIPRKWHRGSP
jgi:hypothetical protein